MMLDTSGISNTKCFSANERRVFGPEEVDTSRRVLSRFPILSRLLKAA